ncbi:MAG TPA: LAGLIDADG family homing endonuclease, partial [Mycobacteriales bacterium]|nr:LAGLIDADG family homing endonuclease [Mycobacteriales bacterium]
MTETVGTHPGGDSGTSEGKRGRHKNRKLRIERIYTTEGVHPYDEVTWERRDVVMTNWRDGSVNFEQRDVEFPDFWSINAANIVTTKYFRGAVGTPQREWSLRQLIDRVVRTYRIAGERHGYFATSGDAETFEHELTWMVLHQVFSFNSPVWFNVGTTAPQQVSACFILAVDDTMESILNWYREEGLIFKGGSGAGLNLSRIRSSRELLSSGGTASGPVSFMRGADASAGTIKSGGATRRAAKMVVLDVDHPDVAEFVVTKAREEDKIRALRDAGFDMDLSGKDIVSVQYQNANNSVRISDEFMRAVEQGDEFGLRARLSGELVGDPVDARSLFHSMAQAAWECADPGIQYDDTINDWHTNPETGRITASNPCFPADQRVTTDKGLIRIGDLVSRASAGEAFGVYTNDVTNTDLPASRIVSTQPSRYLVTGTNEILELRFSDGSQLRCTPNHRLWTANRGWVRAEDLAPADRVVRSFHYAERPFAEQALPARALRSARAATGRALANVPEKWSEEFAHYLGWLVGDGCLTDQGAITVYSGEWERDHVLPRHRELLARITGFASKPSVRANGTHQLRAYRTAFTGLLEGLGVCRGGAAGKVVPDAVFEAPDDVLHAFLRGLYDADGCVVNQRAKGALYVGLGSRSEEFLLGVQELLASLGIRAGLYAMPTKVDSFGYTGKDGNAVSHSGGGLSYDLRISGRHIRRFAEVVGFDHLGKAEKLDVLISSHRFYQKDESVRLTSRVSRGFEPTFNLTEPRNHSYVVSGVVVANCSEYLSLDNSSCNLASMNLMKFLREDGTFDAERFVKAVELVITAMDISICFADFPTEKIGETTRAYRQLGIGYANLGALLMATAHAYDSEGGRALAAAITSLMTGTAYRRSAELAGIVGPYDGYARNAQPHTRVMRKHAAASEAVRPVGADDARIRTLANEQWAECLRMGERNGWRNAQASVLAPTGCLTGDTLITSDRGLVRLDEIGEEYGDRWQALDMTVSTDAGPRRATRFFVNGEEPTRRLVTRHGYRIQGTLAHRVKVVEPGSGEWVWRRLADVASGDVVPLQLGVLVGEPRQVPLPVLDQAYYSGDRTLYVPDTVDADVAELVGYFMGAGSLHAKGIRFRVASEDADVVERLRILGKSSFGVEPVVRQQQGHQEVTFQSVRLARWWQAAGFAKMLPRSGHAGKGWTPRIPAAILETNNSAVYAGFLRGLFEADGSVTGGAPSISTSSLTFADEVRTLLLVLGVATATEVTIDRIGQPVHRMRPRGAADATAFHAIVAGGWPGAEPGYLFDVVDVNEDGGVRPTYDLSVPDNVTYVANGFVSHNTIGLMMGCDTTGVEPDLALVKFKKLVGGGSMQFVNQTVPQALRFLGYQSEQIEAIVEHIAEHGHVVGAPGLQERHYDVFDCAMGERSIAPMGHVRMMAAIQPFISGGISKTVNLPETATVEDIKQIYFESWKLGVKALAVYRDNCKVGQPLSTGTGATSGTGAAREQAAGDAGQAEARPVRRRLPKQRPSITTRFGVGGAEGYMTASSYPEDGLGEVFLKMSKQGSTLAGVMDAFSVAISIGLQ